MKHHWGATVSPQTIPMLYFLGDDFSINYFLICHRLTTSVLRGPRWRSYKFKTRQPQTLVTEVSTTHGPATHTELLKSLCCGRTYDWPPCCHKNHRRDNKTHGVFNIHQKRRQDSSCQTAHRALLKPATCFSTSRNHTFFIKAVESWLHSWLQNERGRHNCFRRKGTPRTFIDSQDQSAFIIFSDSNLSTETDSCVWWKLKMGSTLIKSIEYLK